MFRIKTTQVSVSVTDADGQKRTAGRANGLERPGASAQHYTHEPNIDVQVPKMWSGQMAALIISKNVDATPESASMRSERYTAVSQVCLTQTWANCGPSDTIQVSYVTPCKN